MEERKDASPLSLMPFLMSLWQDYLIWLASFLTRGSSVQHAIILFIYPISNWKPLSDAPPIVLKSCLTTVILPLLVLQAEKLTQGNVWLSYGRWHCCLWQSYVVRRKMGWFWTDLQKDPVLLGDPCNLPINRPLSIISAKNKCTVVSY